MSTFSVFNLSMLNKRQPSKASQNLSKPQLNTPLSNTPAPVPSTNANPTPPFYAQSNAETRSTPITPTSFVPTPILNGPSALSGVSEVAPLDANPEAHTNVRLPDTLDHAYNTFKVQDLQSDITQLTSVNADIQLSKDNVGVPDNVGVNQPARFVPAAVRGLQVSGNAQNRIPDATYVAQVTQEADQLAPTNSMPETFEQTTQRVASSLVKAAVSPNSLPERLIDPRVRRVGR